MAYAQGVAGRRRQPEPPQDHFSNRLQLYRALLPTVPLPWEDPPQIQLLLLLFSAESGERSAVQL
eukprot:COSAG01_NODE_1556_length_9940_cov_13.610337_11_plen_65_part_00